MKTFQPNLFSVPGGREHDLPPKWDGLKVRWEGWEPPLRTTYSLHAGRAVCESCASDADLANVNVGIVDPAPGETFTASERRRTKSGRAYRRRVERPAYPTRRLYAYRCPECRADTVHDLDTDQAWLLDPTDYGVDGSRNE